MKNRSFIFCFLFVAFISCKSENRKPADQSGKESMKKFELVEQWRTDTVFRVPESVIYNKERNKLYVSNMNYEPRLKDGNGYISTLTTNGIVIDLHWVDGLSSPKGMAIVGNKLYVADVDELVEIDIDKAKIIKKIPIRGVKMINDITSDRDGNLFISDSDANKIYTYSNGQISEWLTEGLNAPNGLLVNGDRLLLASMGSMDFSSIDMNSKVKTILTAGINKGDGIAYTGIPGYFLVTDWYGEIFMINPDNSKVSHLNTKEAAINSADIEFIPKQKLLLVPTFYKQAVVAYKLVEK
jgi:DNA-binding beta-propeller fold protein YncE